MATEFCLKCHQPMVETVVGIRLPIFKARLFRYIQAIPDSRVSIWRDGSPGRDQPANRADQAGCRTRRPVAAAMIVAAGQRGATIDARSARLRKQSESGRCSPARHSIG